jgi:hypothetical protein
MMRVYEGSIDHRATAAMAVRSLVTNAERNNFGALADAVVDREDNCNGSWK